jgi:hypothetical protein
MKRLVLVLLALLSLFAFAPAMAQPPAAAISAPDAVADFLATLSDGQVQTPNDLPPAPSFLTGCTSHAQCPTGQLCCYMCGNQPEGDDSFCRMCVTPERGRCPMVI